MPRVRRRGFLRLAAAGLLARPHSARAGAAEPPTAYGVHLATRNTWHGPTALGSLLTERPRPEKPYPGAPRVALPRGAVLAPLPLAGAAQDRAPARAFSGEPIALGVLASLLKLANGVTGSIPGSAPPELRRAAPSAGALYAGEVYVVAERVAGLAPGVYSYAVADHALVPIRDGHALGAVAQAVEAPEVVDGAACAVLLSNVFHRYAWRYGSRGYRYALIDSGHIGENLRLAAAAAGLGHASPLRFADDALNALLASDGREEAVCALHAVGVPAEPRGGESGRTLVEQGGADRSLTEVERYHEATKLAWGAAAGPAPGARTAVTAPDGTLRLAAAPVPSLPVTGAIHQRRSARGFREEAIAQEALGFALELARSPGLALRIVVHRVHGLAPGIYDAGAGERALAEVRLGSFERALVRACLFQEKAGTAAVAFTWLADLRGAAEAGERHYRDRLLEAGAAAERVYLAAESLGLAARNLAGFFDDTLNDLLGMAGRERAVVHLTLLGTGVTLPPVIVAFADCELDRELYQLRRRGRALKLEPKVFDVLVHLIEHRDRVVTKAELLDALWPGETLSESVLPRAIAAARRAVGDTRTKARVIETIHGRGYRFVADLREAVAEPAAAAEPVAPAPSSVFVGRTATLERLERALESACGGRGRLVLLAGEPGIGKTRTAEEIARSARARGAQVVLGRCFEGEGAPAFWPWVQVLRELVATSTPELLRAAAGASGAELAQLVPELRARLPSLPPAAGLAGEQARFRFFDALTGLLRRRAQQGPLVLVLDDLHWADEASLLALEFLAPELRSAALLVIATFRDVEVRRDHPLSKLLGALARVPACERIALRGLEPAEVAALVEAVAGLAPTAQLARTVHEMTEGNPFFVFEVARLLGESGPDAKPSALALPQSVRDAVGRRLDALSPECNEVLRTAAVLGRDFDVALLSRVAGRTPDELLDWLGEALAAGVLVEDPERVGRYAFGHALVRQTLYEELNAPQRVRLHRRVAEALEAAFAASDEPPLSEIAHHYFEAAPGGSAEQAIAAATRAAERAHALLAYEESARLYEQALEALAIAAPEDAGRRFELLAAAGAEHAAAGGRDSARASFRSAAGIARGLGRPDLLARAALGYRGFGEMGIPPEPDTLALLEEARDALGDREPALRSRLLSKLTGTAPYMLSMAQRERLSREAIELARASGDLMALRDALSARYWACLGPDRVAERRAIGEEMVALGEQSGDPLLVFTGHEALFGVHQMCGDAAGADHALAECVRLAGALRYRFVVFQARFFEGARAACAGDLDEAARIFADAYETGRGRVPYAQVLYDAHMLWMRFQRGDRTALGARRTMLEDLSRYWKGSETLTQAVLALIALDEDRLDDARAMYEALAKPGLLRIERDEHFLLTAAVMSDLILAFCDRERAAELYEALLPYAHLLAFHDLLRTFAGSVSGDLGELALVLGRYDVAIAHYEEALERERAVGARAAMVSSRVGLARVLRERGKPGDRARAETLLAEVEAGSAALGIRWHDRFRRLNS